MQLCKGRKAFMVLKYNFLRCLLLLTFSFPKALLERLDDKCWELNETDFVSWFSYVVSVTRTILVSITLHVITSNPATGGDRADGKTSTCWQSEVVLGNCHMWLSLHLEGVGKFLYNLQNCSHLNICRVSCKELIFR